MKKFNKLSRTLIAIVIAITFNVGFSAHAGVVSDFESDGIYYYYINYDAKIIGVAGGPKKYTGSVSIPATVTPKWGNTVYFVTKIGDGAFENCTELTEVSIPNSIDSIGIEAFDGCTSLTEINIPSSVNMIGDGAFSNCNALTSVTIPNSVISIGNSAFQYCSNLTDITIPNSVTSIGSFAFNDTGWYKNQTDGILYLDNCCLGYKGDMPTGVLTIKDETRLIGDRSFFNCTSLTKVPIPNIVTTIGKYAFYGCTNLNSIIIPNSVTAIGSSAFNNCTSLTEVNITDLSAWCKIDFANYGSNPLYNAGHLYIAGKEIKDLVIPNDITEIKQFTFIGCIGLTSLKNHNSTTHIGTAAFQSCTGLTSISIGNSVTKIGNSAFCNCTGLSEVSIPNSVIEIGSNAFDYCSKLRALSLPNSVTKIGSHSFSYNILGSVTIPNSVISIGEHAFCSCTGLTTVNFNAVNCKSMGTESHPIFHGCSRLKTLNIGNDVKSIPNYAFKYCSELTEVTIPNTITTIGYQSFWGCSGMTKMTIGNSVTTISNEAFRFCDGLSEVTIPNSVATIGMYAFSECYLDTVSVCNIIPPNCSYGAFNGSYSALLIAPEDSEGAYTTAREWKNFTNIQNNTRVEALINNNCIVEVERYDIHGRLLSEPTKGINILKMSDGSVRKLLAK